MQNKKTLLSIGIVVVLMILVVGAFTWQNNNPSKEIVKVGVILPLTGGLAKAGTDAQAGLEIAQSDFQNNNIELLFEDDAFDPKKSVTAFSKMVDINEVVAIIGPLNGSSIESIRTLAIQNKLPVITPWGAGNDIGDYLYKNSVEATDEAVAIANKANAMGYKRLAIIYLQNDFGVKHLNAFKPAVANNGGTVVKEEPFPFGTNDYRTQLTKIRATNPDAVYIVNNGAGVGQITKQAHELGLRVQFLGQYATESSDLIQVGGTSLDGLIYSFPINNAAITNKQKKFIDEFKSKVGGEPQVVAYNAYDIYHILLDAVKKCNTDKECINNYVGNIKEFNGVGGKFSIQNGKLIRDFYFKEIKNGAFITSR